MSTDYGSGGLVAILPPQANTTVEAELGVLFQADVAGPYLIDLNPRSFASLSLAMAAGVNLVGIYCDLLRGEAVAPVRGRAGVFYRWLDADVRYALQGIRAGRLSIREAMAMLAPRHGTARGGPESMFDPVPLAARVAYVSKQALTGRRRRLPIPVAPYRA